MTTWTVTSSTILRPHPAAPGFVEDTAFHGGAVELDPFLALTDFHMTEPTFAPHPHAGFSAVTYMFRDSAGSFRNRDSLGDESVIEPGALHWTQAGAGMMHEEIPIEPGLDCHGLQLFVNLRSEHKLAPPRAFHVSAADVPVVDVAPVSRYAWSSGAWVTWLHRSRVCSRRSTCSMSIWRPTRQWTCPSIPLTGSWHSW